MGRAFWVCAALFLSIPSGAQTTLILPFFHKAPEAAHAWIGESVAESLRDSLAGELFLTVDRRDRQEVVRRLGLKPDAPLTRATVLKIAMESDATHVIHGSYETANGEIRLTASLTAVKRLESLGQLVEAGPLSDLSKVQARLAWRAMEKLAPLAAPAREEFLARHPAVKTEAIELFIKGLESELREVQMRDFAHAARLDPAYTAPAFELGKLYFERKQWQEAALWLARIHSNDWRAREASFFLGLSRYQMSDFAAAKSAFAEVAASVPLSEVLNNLGAAQNRLHDPASVESFEKALEGAESDPDYHFNTGYALLQRGDREKAADRFRAALERNPSDSGAMEMLGRCLRPESPVPAGRERLKTDYQEAAFLQLKAVLSPRKSK